METAARTLADALRGGVGGPVEVHRSVRHGGDGHHLMCVFVYIVMRMDAPLASTHSSPSRLYDRQTDRPKRTYLVQLAGGVDDRLERQGHDHHGRGGRGDVHAALHVLRVPDRELELGDGRRLLGRARVANLDPGGAHELPLEDEALQGRGAVYAGVVLVVKRGGGRLVSRHTNIRGE